MEYQIKQVEVNPRYMVDTNGDIYRILDNGDLRKLSPLTGGHRGYAKVRLYDPKLSRKWKDYFVHRLVAIAFIPNPDNLPIINHKDENTLNNNVENLEWCSVIYNVNYGTARERMGKSVKKYYNEHPEARERVSKWASDRKKSADEIRRTAEAKMKPIVAYRYGKKTGEYRSLVDASIDLGIERTNITAVLNGRREIAGGYFFRFKEDVDNGVAEPIVLLKRRKMGELLLTLTQLSEYPEYYVNKNGEIFSTHGGIIKKLNLYQAKVMICSNGKQFGYDNVGYLIAQTFIPNPTNSDQIGHKDGNKLNNNVDNLYWIEKQEKE